MPPVRFLLLGCGGITDAHLPAFVEHPDRLQLCAICDPNAEATARVSQYFGEGTAIRRYDNSDDAIASERNKVDAVLITTPHWLHFPQASTCLEAGLPVLVEKPLCMNLEEMRRLRVYAQRHRSLAVVGQNRRFDARVEWLRDWVASSPGHFGELQSFDLFAFQNIHSWILTKPDPDADFWILDKRRAGGGVVVSLLIHLLDLVRELTGLDYATATARARFEAPFRNGAESSCSGLLSLENGATGTFHANYLAPRHPRAGEGMTLFGTEGMIRLGAGWEYASADGDGPPPWGRPDEGLAPVPVETASPHRSFEAQLLSFARALVTGEHPRNSLADSFNTLATIEAIYDSISNGGVSTEVAHS